MHYVMKMPLLYAFISEENKIIQIYRDIHESKTDKEDFLNRDEQTSTLLSSLYYS